MSQIESAAAKAGLSAVAVAVIAVRIARSKRPPKWFGLVKPPLWPTLGFLCLIAAWVLGTDALTHWRGPWDWRPWQQAPLLASALRVLAVCILGPTVEEMIFRGMLFSWLQERTPIAATIAITAIGWAVLHASYVWWVILIIAVAGVIHGIARWKTGSVVPSILMHMLYNFYAIW